MKKLFMSGTVALIVMAVWAIPSSAAVQGSYVEVRTADVYTGPCFANSEVGVAGRRAILAWDIKQGESARNQPRWPQGACGGECKG